MHISAPGLSKHMSLWKKVYFAIVIVAAIYLAVTLL
jgi:hypothetical protein